MSAMSSPIEIDDEAAIVARARLGDAKAFSELLRRYEGKIFRLALHITQNREDGEDVLQVAFLRATVHRRRALRVPLGKPAPDRPSRRAEFDSALRASTAAPDSSTRLRYRAP